MKGGAKGKDGGSPKCNAPPVEQGCCGQSILAVASTDKHIGLKLHTVRPRLVRYACIKASLVTDRAALNLAHLFVMSGKRKDSP